MFDNVTDEPIPVPDTRVSVTGYRKLSDQEIAVVNMAKEHGQELFDFANDLLTADAMTSGADARCVAIAKTHIQEAVMWLVRSITKPEGV